MPSLTIVLAAQHNSHSLPHWSVNMCKTYLKGGFARKCDDQFVDLVSPVLFCALASSREGIESRGDRTPWNGPQNSFTGEQQRQTHSGGLRADC